MKPFDFQPNLLRTIVELARELPPNVLSALLTLLESPQVTQRGRDLADLAVTQATKEKLRGLEELRAHEPEMGDQVIAFALQAAAQATAVAAAEQRVEIAWTGPATEAVPVRRVDQIVYDMVESAVEEVLLVTYAAYRADRALKVLRDATERRVSVKLVIELARESGGKISFDGLRAFRTSIPLAQVYYWPMDRRKCDASNSYGAMHAKCLIADRNKAFVSSANLTDYALEANMELGLVVEGNTAFRLADHFDQLIVRRVLIQATER